jgi:hypothetical protein
MRAYPVIKAVYEINNQCRQVAAYKYPCICLIMLLLQYQQIFEIPYISQTTCLFYLINFIFSESPF